MDMVTVREEVMVVDLDVTIINLDTWAVIKDVRVGGSYRIGKGRAEGHGSSGFGLRYGRGHGCGKGTASGIRGSFANYGSNRGMGIGYGYSCGDGDGNGFGNGYGTGKGRKGTPW